jgi:hypothetical protein
MSPVFSDVSIVIISKVVISIVVVSKKKPDFSVKC